MIFCNNLFMQSNLTNKIKKINKRKSFKFKLNKY